LACTKTILATQTRIKNSVKNVAMKNIRRGEEVTFDYSTSENENRWYLI
jgi:SET domain-containing protein